MFLFPNPQLKAKGAATKLLEPFGIDKFHTAVEWVWKLPYGRNSDRSNYLLVPIEQRGACSTKHAFLAKLSEEQSISLRLCIGIFLMSAENTPEIAPVLQQFQLGEFPEAHCYLCFDNKRYDFTTFQESVAPHSSISFLHEEEISPEQIGDYKVAMHRRWISEWLAQTSTKFDLDQIWSIREKCIAALA